MSAVLETPNATPDFDAIKQRQHATWASGDYAVIGSTLQIVGENLAEAADLRAGERMLDVAAGNGNATLAAARRFAEVTSTDYVEALLDKARIRAAADGLSVQFRVADAERLPFDDGSFDIVMSTFGVMFTPDHATAASEMLRVVRPGGRIALASWTPGGFIGRLFKIIGAYVPPPPGVKSPSLWGTEPHMIELFGPRAAQLKCERRHFNFRYRSAAHWLEVFRTFYGPMHKAFGAVAPDVRPALERDILALLGELNVGGRDALVVPGEYLEVVITRA
ncbi:class I SAM-dependent methyltransferase [Methyloversatilis discipulorum]|uniref:class I SAM-dependent methyltransferase n=1 Tax=Methyloversatilis discipulorum TaxID=1119528 RepID=UPI00037D447C|nr:class I SAM-dependent methyltransferase [Methyloversatilis discipulorum]